MIDAQDWLPVVGALATGGFGGGMIKTLLDHMRRRRAQTDGVALSLVETLTARLTKIEQDQARERALCDAQLAVLRHRLNNALQLFEGLMMVFEAAPDRAGEYVAQIKERRAQQETAEAAEKAAVQAAIIRSANGAEREIQP